VLIVLLFLAGCGFKATPYGGVSGEADSQVFVYTDADVSIGKDGVTSDDTTMIIVGVKGGTDENLEGIFNHAMDKIQEIFKTRGEVYKSWVKK